MDSLENRRRQGGSVVWLGIQSRHLDTHCLDWIVSFSLLILKVRFLPAFFVQCGFSVARSNGLRDHDSWKYSSEMNYLAGLVHFLLLLVTGLVV